MNHFTRFQMAKRARFFSALALIAFMVLQTASVSTLTAAAQTVENQDQQNVVVDETGEQGNTETPETQGLHLILPCGNEQEKVETESIVVDQPEQPCTSTVQLCKEDKPGNVLGGWDLMLVSAQTEQVYQGTTHKNTGCFKLQDVPFGTYTIDEVLKDGWENVPAGPEDDYFTKGQTVVVNESTEKFILVNKKVNTDVTISASKIVCDSEQYLPNWSGAADITATTATDFIENNSEHCHLAPGWKFQWGYADKDAKEGVDMTLGDWIGEAGIGGDSTGVCPAPYCGANTRTGDGYAKWHTFDTQTSGTGDSYVPATATVTDLKDASSLWVREVLKPNYVPYSDPTQDQTLGSDNVSAEIYCHKDVLNYDNYDLIGDVQAGQTYYCVAFNAHKDELTVTGKKFNDKNGNGTKEQGENGLENFHILAVKKAAVDTKNVPSDNPDGIDSENLPAGKYLLKVSGHWQGASGVQNRFDAEYSTQDAWVSHADGTTGYAGAGLDQGDFLVNDTFRSFGAYSNTHEYYTVITHPIAGTMNFSVFDGDAGTHVKNEDWYDDNVGTIKVEVFQVIDEAVTAANGDYALTIPAGSGDVTILELQQDGWMQTAPASGVYDANFDMSDDFNGFNFGNKKQAPPKVTINAQKIVCPQETDLPNMSGGANIGETTAADFLATHPQCHLETGWKFQYGFYDKDGQEGVDMTTGNWVGAAAIGGDSTGLCPAPYCGDNVTTGPGYDQWHNFDTATTGTGAATVEIGDLKGSSGIWVREELKAGYVPFADPKLGQPLGSNNVSAEIYCNGDVLNYDNYDLIGNPTLGQTYNCVAFNVKKGVTIQAYKIICDSESDLPNWGTGAANITATTASTFLAGHPNCHAQTAWDFQWGYGDKAGQEGVDLLKGSHVGPASAAGDSSAFPCAPSCGPNTTTGSGYNQWHTFDSATSNGGNTAAIATIPDLQGANRLWVREVLQSGYVPFSAPDLGMNPGPNVSAELYCNDDVLNYDNFDYIFQPQLEQTYYCVAFNALKPRDGGGSNDNFTLTVHITSTNEGSGTVTDEEETPNINCHGLPQTGTCTFQYAPGTAVTLTADPDSGSSFTDTWFGDCTGNNPVCNLTMNSNKDVTAHFSKASQGGGGCVVNCGGGGGTPGTPQVLGDSTTLPSVLSDNSPTLPFPEVGGAVTELPRTGIPMGLLLFPAVLALPFLKKRK